MGVQATGFGTNNSGKIVFHNSKVLSLQVFVFNPWAWVLNLRVLVFNLQVLEKTILAKLFSAIPTFWFWCFTFRFWKNTERLEKLLAAFRKYLIYRFRCLFCRFWCFVYLPEYRQIGAGIFVHTQNVGFVAKSGPTRLIYGAMGTREADSGIRLAPE